MILCGSPEPMLDEVHLDLRRDDSAFGFLLEGMQHKAGSA